MDGTVAIYALVDPSDGALRYIGRTSVPLEVRVWQHWMDRATGSAAKVAWIGALREAGKQPIVKVLEVVAVAEAADAERRHIAAARAQGAQLFNTSCAPRRAVDAPDERDVVRYTVRIPPELYGQVARLADEAGWAVHSEVLLALAEHVRRRRRTGGGVRGVPGGARVPQTAAASRQERAP